MNIKRTSIIALTAIGLTMPAAGVSLAQEAAPAPAAPSTQQPAAPQPGAQEFGDETLRSFAVAFLATEEISQRYQPQLEEAQAAQDQTKMQEIQREASQEMVTAVESVDGISVQEYTAVMQAAQTDPELAQKLTDFIGEASGGEASGTAPEETAPAQ
jgi:hypothetical protein